MTIIFAASMGIITKNLLPSSMLSALTLLFVTIMKVINKNLLLSSRILIYDNTICE